MRWEVAADEKGKVVDRGKPLQKIMVAVYASCGEEERTSAYAVGTLLHKPHNLLR
jgi:hypothetical protein